MGLQLGHLVLVLQEGLLQLEVLVLQLRHQGSVHLVQSAKTCLVCLDQAVLGVIEQLFKVVELCLVNLYLS